MGLFDKWVLGIDTDAEQARSDELDRKLAAENMKDLQSGHLSQAAYEDSQRNIAKGHLDVEAEVDAAFAEGLQDGIDNVRGTAGSIISFPFKLIPWQLWLIGVVALLVYMGGWAKLAGILNKK